MCGKTLAGYREKWVLGGLLKERFCFFFWSMCVPVYMERLVPVYMEVENGLCRERCRDISV